MSEATTKPNANAPAFPRTGFAEEYPFASHFLDHEGFRSHYLDEGQGEVLLCVHGNPTWSFAYRHLIRDLSPHYRVIAVDHIGCGLSDKPQAYEYTLEKHIRNLERFIETLDLKHITLIAHDWGGAIGMGTAGRMPKRFSRFVLMNTAAFHSTRIPFRIAICRWPILGPLGVRGLNLFAKAALSMAVTKHDRMTRAVRQGYLAPYNSWANRIAVQRFVEDIPMKETHPSYKTLVEVEEGLSQFRESPMQLIWGMRDWCFTPEFLEEFQQRFPQAEATRFEEAGHYLFEDAKEHLSGVIREFLAKHPVGV